MRSCLAVALNLVLVAAGCGDPAAPPPSIATVQVEASATVLPVGFEAPLSLKVWLENGTQAPSGAATWSVDRPDLAAVDTGAIMPFVRALGGHGRITVTATIGAKSGSVSLDVIPLPGRLAVEQWNGDVEDGLAIIPMDGSPRTLIPVEPDGYSIARPAWSPDGTRLAYACKNGVTKAVCVSRADGSERGRIAASDASDDFGPSWAPDGTSLLYGNEGQAWRVASDGSGTPELVSLPLPSGLSTVLAASLAPDESRLAYSIAGRFYDPGEYGGTLLCLTSDNLGVRCLDQAGDPAWSADGTTLVAYLVSQDGLVKLSKDGTVSGLLAGKPEYLEAGGWYPASPTWSPDGAWIAFSSWPGQVYLVRASDGSNLVRLFSESISHTRPRDYAHPAWGR